MHVCVKSSESSKWSKSGQKVVKVVKSGQRALASLQRKAQPNPPRRPLASLPQRDLASLQQRAQPSPILNTLPKYTLPV
jgi:hypothetical protein